MQRASLHPGLPVLRATPAPARSGLVTPRTQPVPKTLSSHPPGAVRAARLITPRSTGIASHSCSGTVWPRNTAYATGASSTPRSRSALYGSWIVRHASRHSGLPVLRVTLAPARSGLVTPRVQPDKGGTPLGSAPPAHSESRIAGAPPGHARPASSREGGENPLHTRRRCCFKRHPLPDIRWK